MEDWQRLFRSVLGSFATGVTIITTSTEDRENIGVTVNSFSSVSLDPPLIQFSLGRKLYSVSSFSSARFCAVNVLSEGQSELSTRFAKALDDKWSGVEHYSSVNGVPLLQGVLAWLECEQVAQYEAGDHIIFVCKVVDFEHQPHLRPLVFFHGKYHELHRPAPTPEWFAEAMHGWGA